MGTRCLVTVMEGNKEIVCLYRQFDGYPTGMGTEIVKGFKGYRITNGISGDSTRTANGMGCFAAQLVAKLKDAVGNVYLRAPETREVGEEFIYRLSEKDGRLWLDVSEGEVAFFGMPGTKPELMEWLYSGPLDGFDPKNCGEAYH